VAEVVAQKADGNLELLDLEVRRQLSIWENHQKLNTQKQLRAEGIILEALSYNTKRWLQNSKVAKGRFCKEQSTVEVLRRWETAEVREDLKGRSWGCENCKTWSPGELEEDTKG
jgi:hypothetical protein